MKKLIFTLLILVFFLHVSAVCAEEVTQKWTSPTGDGIRSSPAIGSDGTIYFGSDDGKFYALNPTDGSVKWTYTISDRGPIPIRSSPAIGSDGTIYFGTDSGNFYALYPAVNPDKRVKWAFPAAGKIYSTPAIGSDGTIYFGTDAGNFYALNPALNPDKRVKWYKYIGKMVYASPAISSDGTIYISGDGFLSALNPDNGDIKWTYKDGNIGGVDYSLAIGSSPAIGSDGTIYIGSRDGILYAINPNNGQSKWMYMTARSLLTSPAIGSDDTIYVGSTTGTLFAYSPNGVRKWTYQTTCDMCIPMILSSPAIGRDGTIYFGSYDGKFYALNPDDGGVEWTYETTGFISTSPAIGPDGTIYFGTQLDNKLYALPSSSYGLADSSWPMFHHDARHTGLDNLCNPDGTSIDGNCILKCGASINCVGALPNKANPCCSGCYYTDLNGDEIVNIIDIFAVATVFGSKSGDPKWNPVADLNRDETINILDIFLVVKAFGKSC
jgi:outer membrane protein assembly factor BamB